MFRIGRLNTGIAVIFSVDSDVLVNVRDGSLELMTKDEESYKELLSSLEQVKISMCNVIEKEILKK